MLPAASWAGTSGNATSTNLMVLGSPPSFATDSMMVTSPAAPEAVDGDLAPGQVPRARVMPDAFEATTALMSSPVGVGRGVVADDDDAEVLQVGAERAERLADREVEVAVGQRRDGQRAALGGQHLDLEAVLGEDARRDAAPERGRLGDGQRRDPDLAQVARGLVGRWWTRRSRCIRSGRSR